LASATVLALIKAEAQPDHPEHRGATSMLRITSPVQKSRYRSAKGFPDPDWLAAGEKDAPGCFRFVRYELGQAVEARVIGQQHCRKAILVKWLGEEEVKRRWPRIPLVVPIGDEMRLKISDSVDRLSLEIMNLRAWHEEDAFHRCWQSQVVREALHDVA